MTNIWIEQQYQFCPRCGTQNPNVGQIPFRCQECQFACFFGPVAAVGSLIVDEQQRLLLVRRSRNPGMGQWGLPGGFIDRDETVEQALRREVSEETGLELTEISFLVTYPNQYHHSGFAAPVIDLFFLGKVDAEAQISLAKEELDQFEWTSEPRDYLDQLAFPSNRRAIEFWLESRHAE